MAWYRNLRLTPKLIGSFVLVAILAAVVGGAGFAGLHSQNTQVDRLTSVSIPSLGHIQDVQADTLMADAYLQGGILTAAQSGVNLMIDSAGAAEAQAQKDWQAALDLPFDTAAAATLARQTTPLLQQ